MILVYSYLMVEVYYRYKSVWAEFMFELNINPWQVIRPLRVPYSAKVTCGMSTSIWLVRGVHSLSNLLHSNIPVLKIAIFLTLKTISYLIYLQPN